MLYFLWLAEAITASSNIQITFPPNRHHVTIHGKNWSTPSKNHTATYSNTITMNQCYLSIAKLLLGDKETYKKKKD